MSAPRWPIVLEEGADFDLQIEWQDKNCTPINIASYGGQLEISNRLGASTTLITASTSNGLITKAAVSGVTSEWVINIPAASVDAVKTLIGDDAGYTFVVWPTAASPDVNPKRLLHGPVTYSESYAT